MIIVQKNKVYELIDKQSIENFEEMIKGKYFNCANKDIYVHMFKIIPFYSLGNENGLIIGFEPDAVNIYTDTNYNVKDVMIGIYDGKLSKTHSFDCIIGSSVFKGGDNYEFIEIA